MEREEQATEYVTLASQLAASGSYSKAFDLYMLAFDKDASLKERYEQEFRVVLIQLNEVLVGAGKMEDIFANFAKALHVFPSNSNLLNDIGKYLYKFGFYTEAWGHFQKALKIDPTFVDAEKNVNSIKNLLLERWHFRMLNDKRRNDAYYDAIKDSTNRFKDTILDIGTGTGILAMFSSEFTATAVTAIEASEIMAWIAECVTQGNDRHDIVIINKMSTTMNYRDIGGKRSLVVTEMFDAGLFGEHVLQTLSHAWEYFTIPSTRFIPNKAEFFVIAARCDHLNRRYQLSTVAKKALNIENMHVHIKADEDSYDCEDVHLLKQLKYVSESKSLLEVDFNDYRDIQEKLKSTDPYEVQFTATEDDEINVVIGYFNLYLTKDITLTTDPRAEDRANAWQQAVFFDNVPKSVKKGEVIDAYFLINGGKLTMLPFSNTPVTRISPEAIRFLNDEGYMKVITGCIGMTCIYLGQMADISEITMVDLSPFPMFGMLMLKRGAQSLVCYAKTESDTEFFQQVFEANKINWEKVTVLEGDNLGKNVLFKDEKYHAIFSHVLDLSGDIDPRLRDVSLHLRSNHLMQGGLFMPANIKLMGQIVNSPWLNINNRVYDENVKTYRVGEYINKYEVSQNFCIDFANLGYTTVTEPTCIGPLYSDLKTEIISMPITESGEANAILCWYELELTEELEVLSTNRPGSFMDGTLFLISPPQTLTAGRLACIVRTNDDEGAYKIAFRNEVS